MRLVLGKILVQFAVASAFAFGGFFTSFYSFDKFILWRLNLESHFQTCAFLAAFLGIPIGSVLGISLADKLFFKSRGFNVSGIVVGLLLCVLAVALATWLLRGRTGNIGMVSIPFIASFFSLVGYNFPQLLRLLK
jgi:hypothetical protein